MLDEDVARLLTKYMGGALDRLAAEIAQLKEMVGQIETRKPTKDELYPDLDPRTIPQQARAWILRDFWRFLEEKGFDVTVSGTRAGLATTIMGYLDWMDENSPKRPESPNPETCNHSWDLYLENTDEYQCRHCPQRIGAEARRMQMRDTRYTP